MAELKRDIVKYIRDRAKNNYEKGSECYICGVEVKLDFHHYYTLAPLIHDWMKKTGHDPKYILSIRDDFYRRVLGRTIRAYCNFMPRPPPTIT